MFDIETVSLHCGQWRAEVAPQMGMNTVSLTCSGRKVLRTPSVRAELERDPCVYGTPILLPPNRTEGGHFTFDGQGWDLPVNEPAFGNHLHGLVHRQNFSVMKMSETQVTGIYENQGQTFPYPYRMCVTCAVQESGYYQEFFITNTGTVDMPLTFGLHTVFAAPEQIRVPIDRRWIVNDRYIPTGELEELSPEALTYRTGTAPEGKIVRGFYTSRGCDAQVGDFCYRVSDNFDQWVLWNGDGNGGFCAVEPMRGAVNALNSGVGLLRLTPGEIVRFATAIEQN